MQTIILLFGLFALTDVANGAGNQNPLLSLQWFHADFDGKLTTVFVDGAQFQARRCHLIAAIREENRVLLQVNFAIALGHKDGHCLARKFLGCVTQ